MSRTYREFGDLLNAYNNAGNEWMPIQKAHELLDSVNEDEIWEQRHAAANALFEYISELVAERDQAKAMVNMWIPVSERLPEEDTDGNTLMAICRHSGEWVRAPFGAEFADEFVRHYTHWMYAPQPPEVQE